MFYEHNFVTDSIGFIFVNTQSKGLPYRNAKARGEYAAKLLKDVLEFKTVEIFTDLSKEEILVKMDYLKNLSKSLIRRDTTLKQKAREYFE